MLWVDRPGRRKPKPVPGPGDRRRAAREPRYPSHRSVPVVGTQPRARRGDSFLGAGGLQASSFGHALQQYFLRGIRRSRSDRSSCRPFSLFKSWRGWDLS